ncbi:zinc finger, CCHC-type containing protein, partial [Tanacetum coccineum]
MDSLDLDGSITTWEDLTTRFLAQFFPPGRTAKLRNDILMFQQHQGESISEAWTRFKDMLQKCEIDRAAGAKLRDKNADESWEIIENLALYDHEVWNDSKEIVKPVKAISTPQRTSKKLDRRLLELEDQINFLLKGKRPTLRPSSTYIPQAYAEAVYSNPARKTKMGHQSRTPSLFMNRKEINDKMAEMFRLLKKLTTREEERNENDDMPSDGGINGTNTEMLVKEAEKETKAENGTKNKPIKRAE